MTDLDCIRCQILQKCFKLNMSVQLYRPDIVEVSPNHTEATHVIFISDTHLEAWSLDKEIGQNNSDWFGTIDTLDGYLRTIKEQAA